MEIIFSIICVNNKLICSFSFGLGINDEIAKNIWEPFLKTVFTLEDLSKQRQIPHLLKYVTFLYWEKIMGT